ncbi:MAG: CDGSH iron-sulfur domain-containing protein [Actinobacteria bacterium]|nr:CDGSH iron-sulfur domain-containing protein [Actinomycetota bacterium]
MSDRVKIRIKPNGSIRVTGTVDIVDADGNILETKTDFSLCRCGHSKDKPLRWCTQRSRIPSRRQLKA